MNSQSPQKNLLPTHSCFDDIGDMMGYFFENGQAFKIKQDLIRIAHGILEIDNFKISHAWLESEEPCYDMKILDGSRIMIEYDRSDFYKSVSESVLYSWREAFKKSVEFKNSGPWIQKYIDLCGTEKKTAMVGVCSLGVSK